MQEASGSNVGAVVAAVAVVVVGEGDDDADSLSLPPRVPTTDVRVCAAAATSTLF